MTTTVVNKYSTKVENVRMGENESFNPSEWRWAVVNMFFQQSLPTYQLSSTPHGSPLIGLWIGMGRSVQERAKVIAFRATSVSSNPNVLPGPL